MIFIEDPRTKYFQPSPLPPARQEKEKKRKTSEEKEDANNPVTDVLVYNPIEKSKTTSTFSSFQTTLPFSNRTSNSNLPIFRRKPLRLVDPSHTFRLLEQLEEELPSRKSTAPIAVRKLRIQTLSDPNWVRRPQINNAPLEIKKDTDVRPEIPLDYGVVIAKPFDFVKAEGVIVPNNMKKPKKESVTDMKSEDTGGAAYKEQTIKQPEGGGWGANMFLAKDQWKCEGCLAKNKDTFKKCPSCKMPRGKTSYDGVTYDDEEEEEKKEVAGSIGASGFSFAKPAASIGASGFSFGTNNSSVSNTGFTFGAPKEDKEPPKFTFGAPKEKEPKEQPKSLFSTSSTPAKPAPSGGFLFGAKKEEPSFNFGEQPPIKESITIIKSPTTDTSNGHVFKFGKTPDSKPITKDAGNTPGFALDKNVTFSATPAPKRKKDTGSNPFAPKETPEPFEKVDTPMPKNGVEKKESAPKTDGFSFDNAVKKVKSEAPTGTSLPTTTATTRLQFTFGQTPETKEPKKLAPIAESKPEAAKPSFAFGQQPKSDTPAAFGASSEPTKPTPPFTFGQKSAETPASSSFGSTPSSTTAFGQKPAETPASSSFGSVPASTPAFGQKPTETPATSFTAPSATSFGQKPTPANSSFGSTPAPSTKRKSEDPTSSFAPAPATTTSAFTFGAKPKTDATPAQPFSTNATFPPAQSFGSTNASSGTSFTQPFGGTNTTASTGFNPSFGASAPAPTPFGGSTSTPFGTSNPPASASFGASNPPASGATSFGSSTQPFGNTASAQPAAFTPAPSASFPPAFGASGATGNFAAPAPSNFSAAPATGFNASFNPQTPQAQNFGANPSGGFNATASFAATPGFNAGGGAPSFSLGAGGSKTGESNTRRRRVIRARRPPGTK